MMIIVEGVDRVGKSTLCNKLSKATGIVVHKYSGLVKYKDMNNLEETDKMLGIIQVMKETNATLIFDRFHVTDFVYGSLERNYDKAAASQRCEKIENKLDEVDAIYIYVKATDIKSSSEQHGKNLEKYEELFDFYFSKCKLKKFVCTYEQMDKVIEKVRSIVNM